MLDGLISVYELNWINWLISPNKSSQEELAELLKAFKKGEK